MTDLDPGAEIPVEKAIVLAREHRPLSRRRLARADSAAAIDVERLREDLERSRIDPRQLRGDGVPTDKLTQPARLRRVQTQQAHVVNHAVLEGRIGVERTLRIGHRESSPLADGLSRVTDVVERHTLDILCNRFAQELAHDPVKGQSDFNTEWIARWPFDNREAATLLQGLVDRPEFLGPGATDLIRKPGLDQRR